MPPSATTVLPQTVVSRTSRKSSRIAFFIYPSMKKASGGTTLANWTRVRIQLYEKPDDVTKIVRTGRSYVIKHCHFSTVVGGEC